jgi:ABC-2 type transport system permease protein
MEEDKLNTNVAGRIKMNSWMQFILVSLIVTGLAVTCNYIHLRLDLTEDHRYTLSAPTHNILSGLKNDVYVQVFLDGEMEIAFKRLRRSVKEMLDEFRIASGNKVDYEFINPSEGKDIKARNNQYQALVNKGLNQYPGKGCRGRNKSENYFPGHDSELQRNRNPG